MFKVDVMAELEPYLHRFKNWEIKGDELVSCSPFRDERRPSFGVNVETGLWNDLGGHGQYKKGNFTLLLAYLHGVTYEETVLYLKESYGLTEANIEALELDINISLDDSPITIGENVLDVYQFRHPYLTNRGITERCQQAFDIGYSKDDKAVTIPWRNEHGGLIAVKFRTVKGKMFWYYSGSAPIKQHIFGLHMVRRHQFETVWLCESETDALYCWSHGLPAVALGGATLSKAQETLLLRSGVSSIVIATDNDKVGNDFAKQLTKRLGGYFQMSRVQFPNNVKDVNELSIEQLKSAEITARVDILPKIDI